MKDLKIFGIVLFCGLLVASCGSKPKVISSEIDDFPHVVNLIGKEINWINNYCIDRMVIMDSLLLLTDKCNEQYLYFYNLKDTSFLCSRISKGKGPGEFPSTPLIDKYWIRDSMGINFFIHENGYNNKCWKYTLKQAIEDFILIPNHEYDKIDALRCNSRSILNDSLIVGTAFDTRGSFFIYNMNNHKIISWFPRLKISAFVHPERIFLPNMEKIFIRPDGEKIIGNFPWLKRLHVYDREGNLELIIVDHNKPEEPDFSKISMSKRSKGYYEPIFPLDDYIIAINLDICMAEDQPNSEVMVFSYTGKPLFKYLLDIPVGSCTIDPNTNRLYCVSNKDDKKYYYDLQGLKK